MAKITGKPAICKHLGGKVITVRNTEDAPETKAEILVQNQINYTPQISVIIPVYNTEKYLRECLDSVINQTLKKIEIICVDDGSTDDSPVILKEYAAKDRRMTIITQKNLFAGVARNAGLAVAKGEYLSFLDSDDSFDLNMLEDAYNKAKENDADIVSFGYNVYDDLEKKTEYTFFPLPAMSETEKLLSHAPNPWSKIFKHAYVKANKLFYESLESTNDLTFVFTAIALTDKISVLNFSYVNYRKRYQGSISSGRGTKIMNYVHAVQKLQDNLKKQGKFDELNASFKQMVKKIALWELEQCYDRKLFDKAVAELSVIIPDEKTELVEELDRVYVSVIIPVYNTEKYLRECLDSVINQTLEKIEIICVNDGSTDNSLAILKEYAAKDRRIAVINQKNKGLSCVRNNAMKAAKGSYVQFLDSDDYLVRDACEKLYRKCAELDLDMLLFSGVNFDNKTKNTLSSPYYEFKYLPPDWKYDVFSYKDCKSFLVRMAVSSTLALYKKSFLDKHGVCFPVGLCFEDNLFFIKTITKAQRVLIDKTVYYYRRIHENSITQNWGKHFKDYLSITDMVLTYLKNAKIGSDIFNQYKTAYFYSITRGWNERCTEKQRQSAGSCLRKLMKKYNVDTALYYELCKKNKLRAYFLLPYNLLKLYFLKYEYSRLFPQSLRRLRIDIKNFGTAENAVKVHPRQKNVLRKYVQSPQGTQAVISGTESKYTFKIKVLKSGVLRLELRAENVAAKNAFVPLWADYASVKINGREILAAPVATRYDKPYCFEVPVKDRQVICLEVIQQYHRYTKAELKEVISALYGDSCYITANLDKQVRKTYKKITAAF